jgi:sarcosine oxidase
MRTNYDCIVLGLGGFGSGALDHLARRGQTVLGIERFGVAHDRGSSHGETRIIRQAYFEHPDYVPLLKRAYDLWAELEDDCRRPLANYCGLMLAGPPDGEAISGAHISAAQHGIAIEDVPRSQFEGRFPGFRIPDKFAAVYEPGAGFLRVEECVRAHIERAEQHGATLALDETVISWSANGDTIRLQTDRGEYSSAQLVITAGAWAQDLLADLHVPLTVLRKPIFWHAVTTSDHNASAGRPAFYVETAAGAFYGFPALDDRSLKVAEHTGGRFVDDPLQLDREIHPFDTDPVRTFLENHMSGVDLDPVQSAVCMYTMTEDHHFIVDRHPEHPNVVVGAGFSGHGFKFTTVLGEAMADLAVDGKTDLPIGFLSIHRDTLGGG